MLGICDVQLRHPDQTLDWVRLPDRLQDAGEGPPKLQRLRFCLPAGGPVDSVSAGVQMCRKVEDQARTAMFLRHCCDAGDVQIIPKRSYCVCRWEEDAKAVFDPLLNIPLDEGGHLWCAC